MQEILKTVGVMELAKDNGKFFLIREKVEQSQNFCSVSETWKALRTSKIRWHKVT